jgi:hypothetical protein
VAVVGGAGQRLHVGDELAALAVLQGVGDGTLIAERPPQEEFSDGDAVRVNLSDLNWSLGSGPSWESARSCHALASRVSLCAPSAVGFCFAPSSDATVNLHPIFQMVMLSLGLNF